MREYGFTILCCLSFFTLLHLAFTSGAGNPDWSDIKDILLYLVLFIIIFKKTRCKVFVWSAQRRLFDLLSLNHRPTVRI